jgi:L-ascorbate metabolism protein UlaG (beta-lactamase superfamily)
MVRKAMRRAASPASRPVLRLVSRSPRVAVPGLVVPAFMAVFAAAAAACAKPGSPPDSGAAPPPSASAATTGTRVTDHLATAKGPLDITPLNHASVLFEWDGKAVYVDPTTVALKDPALPKADVVFVTDIHGDHLDVPALERIHKPGTIVVGPPAVADKAHVDVVMKNGETRDVAGLTVDAVPMYNLTRGPAPGQFYHDKGRGNGYVLGFAGTRVYLSGDTECTAEMRELKGIDAAFVCMNLPYTMPPSEAVECVEAFRPKILFPYHYRGSDLTPLQALGAQGTDVRIRSWY